MSYCPTFIIHWPSEYLLLRNAYSSLFAHLSLTGLSVSLLWLVDLYIYWLQDLWWVFVLPISSSLWLAFSCVNSVNSSNLSIFCGFCVLFEKYLSTSSFMVLPFHDSYWNDFVHIVRLGSMPIFSHTDIQPFWHYLLKRSSLLHRITAVPLLSVRWLWTWGSVSGLCCVPWSLSLSASVPYCRTLWL